MSDGCVSLCICMYVRMWFLYTYWCSSVCTYVRMYGIHDVKKLTFYGRCTGTSTGVLRLQLWEYCS